MPEDETLYPHEWILKHIDIIMQVVVSTMVMIAWLLIMYLFYKNWVIA